MLASNILAMTRILAMLAAIGIVALGLGALETGTAKSGAAGAPPNRIDQIRDHHLPNMLLTDHTGRPRRFYDHLVAGRTVAINFMYASCSKTCGLSSQNMARLQDELGARLGRDVFLYSISLDPEHDSPEALTAFREKQGAKPGWTFLVPGSAADAALLRRQLGVYEPEAEKESDLSNHTGMIVMGNEPKGRWTMAPSLIHPIRLRQALERILLPPNQWARGVALVDALPREERDTGLERSSP